MIIALEGLPGAGKSTTARALARLLGANLLLEETAGHPFLAQIYANRMDRDDLTIELGFLLVHANPWRQLDPNTTTVTDFSPVKDLLFAEDVMSGADLDLFVSVYTHLFSVRPRPDVVIHLRLDPELCLRRVQTRSQDDPRRSFEQEMSLERLQSIAARYSRSENSLGDIVLRLDVDETATVANVASRAAELVRTHQSRTSPES